MKMTDKFIFLGHHEQFQFFQELKWLAGS